MHEWYFERDKNFKIEKVIEGCKITTTKGFWLLKKESE